MSECIETTLGQLCDDGGGDIQTGPFGSQLHASDYVEDGVPSVMPMNIGDNVIDSHGIARITVAHSERLKKYRLRSGDIVYSRRGDVEKRALIRSENDGWLCGTGCLRIRLGNGSIADPIFVSYALGLEESRRWVVNHAVGATMPNLNTKIMRALPIMLPPPAVQAAVAQVLGALDDKIAANAGLVDSADELARGLAEAAIDPGKMEPLVAAAAVTMGSSPTGETFNDHGQGIPFYQGTRDFGVRYPRRRIWTTDPIRIAQVHDCLFSVRAPVGAINLADEELCIGRGLASVRTKRGMPYILFHMLSLSSNAWKGYQAEGTVFGSINGQQLSALRIHTVRESETAELEARLESLELRIRSAMIESNALAKLRDTLLPYLMSGKLRVRDAEKQVEEVV